MKKPTETIYERLRRLLQEHQGHHNRIAKESGVSQATVSRIHLGLAVPTLHTAQPLLDWFERNERSAVRGTDARRRVQARRADGPAAAPLGQ